MLIAGIGLVFLLTFLIAITVPNLRREVAPPEISEPGQVERNRNASPSSTAPTSGTLSGRASDSTSGTHPLLNLDDYPHLSPTMRKMTQVWLDQLSVTDKSLETISDPVQRAQLLEFLEKCRRNTQAFLNEPLRWGQYPDLEWDKYADGNGTYYTDLKWRKFFTYSEYLNTVSSIKNLEDWMQFKSAHPEFEQAFNKESSCAGSLLTRMGFEFAVYNQRWDFASFTCAVNDLYPQMHPFQDVNSWEEELYCMRQMGVLGTACLAGRSYQHAIDPQWPDPSMSETLYYLRGAGYLPIFLNAVIRRTNVQENVSPVENPD
jgi:hypothetical protein